MAKKRVIKRSGSNAPASPASIKERNNAILQLLDTGEITTANNLQQPTPKASIDSGGRKSGSGIKLSNIKKSGGAALLAALIGGAVQTLTDPARQKKAIESIPEAQEQSFGTFGKIARKVHEKFLNKQAEEALNQGMSGNDLIKAADAMDAQQTNANIQSAETTPQVQQTQNPRLIPGGIFGGAHLLPDGSVQQSGAITLPFQRTTQSVLNDLLKFNEATVQNSPSPKAAAFNEMLERSGGIENVDTSLLESLVGHDSRGMTMNAKNIDALADVMGIKDTPFFGPNKRKKLGETGVFKDIFKRSTGASLDPENTGGSGKIKQSIDKASGVASKFKNTKPPTEDDYEATALQYGITVKDLKDRIKNRIK